MDIISELNYKGILKAKETLNDDYIKLTRIYFKDDFYFNYYWNIIRNIKARYYTDVMANGLLRLWFYDFKYDKFKYIDKMIIDDIEETINKQIRNDITDTIIVNETISKPIISDDIINKAIEIQDKANILYNEIKKITINNTNKGKILLYTSIGFFIFVLFYKIFK